MKITLKYIAYFLILLVPQISIALENEDLFQQVKALAENGISEASYHLAMLYNNGIGTPKDINSAYKWFIVSANSGDPLGHYKIGCYLGGQFKEFEIIDKEQSLTHKLVAAKAGYSLAQYDVAGKYHQQNDIQNSIKWLEKSAAQGHPKSFRALYSFYSQGIVTPVDHKKAYYYLKIIGKHTNQSNKEKISQKLNSLKNKLGQEELAEIDVTADKWRAKETKLTLRASRGIKATYDLIEKDKT